MVTQLLHPQTTPLTTVPLQISLSFLIDQLNPQMVVISLLRGEVRREVEEEVAEETVLLQGEARVQVRLVLEVEVVMGGTIHMKGALEEVVPEEEGGEAGRTDKNPILPPTPSLVLHSE